MYIYIYVYTYLYINTDSETHIVPTLLTGKKMFCNMAMALVLP